LTCRCIPGRLSCLPCSCQVAWQFVLGCARACMWPICMTVPLTCMYDSSSGAWAAG
jgi:hypothetical protein